MEHLSELDPGEDDRPLGPHPVAFGAVLAAVLALAYLSTNLFFQRVGATSLESGPPLVEVPEVIGHDRVEALALLGGEGFTVTEEPIPNTNVAVGQVVDQLPPAGSRIEPAGSVTIVVSAGAGFVKVPDVRGSPLDELELMLFVHGLALGEVTYQESDEAEGEVVDQRPPPGRTVPTGTVVQVVASSGPPIIEIPDVSGLTALEAARTLRAAGFEVVYEDRYSWSVRRGLAIGTQPGDEAPRGSQLVLRVSLGPAPVRPTQPQEPDPPASTTSPTAGRETYAPSDP